MADSYESLLYRIAALEQDLSMTRAVLYARMQQYELIPRTCMDAMKRHIEDGGPTGSFVQAVLQGDLREAVACADDTNVWLLPVYASWLYNHAPAGSWGSAEAVQRWREYRARATHEIDVTPEGVEVCRVCCAEGDALNQRCRGERDAG